MRWQRLCGFTPLDEISRKRAQGTRSAAALELLRTLNSPRAGYAPPSVACFTLTAAVTADGTPVGMVDVLQAQGAVSGGGALLLPALR